MADETTKTTTGPSPGSSPAKQTGTAGSSGKSGGPSGADRDRRVRAGGATGAQAEEYEALGVDARLDNRVGDQRPQLHPLPKPQQLDGPEVGHFGEHADEHRAEFEELTGGPEGEPLGMRSVGPHGRGDED